MDNKAGELDGVDTSVDLDELDDTELAGADDGSIIEPDPQDENIEGKGGDGDEDLGAAKDDGGEEEEEEGSGGDENIEGEGGAEQAATLGFIPKGRYDSVARRADAERDRADGLEQQLADIKRGVDNTRVTERAEALTTTDPSGEVAEIDANLNILSEKYAAAIADGDATQMHALRNEERALERQRTDLLFAQRGREMTAEARESVRYDMTVEALEKQYDVLNPDQEAYDPNTAGEVLDLAQAFEARGASKADAVLRAVGYVFKGYEVKPETPEKKAPEKRKTDVSKNLDAAAKQGKDLSGVGDSSAAAGKANEIDVMKLSEEEFDALPEETLRRLQGDNF